MLQSLWRAGADVQLEEAEPLSRTMNGTANGNGAADAPATPAKQGSLRQQNGSFKQQGSFRSPGSPSKKLQRSSTALNIGFGSKAKDNATNAKNDKTKIAKELVIQEGTFFARMCKSTC